MRKEVEEKRDKMIVHFGSVNAYQLKVFPLVPSMPYMTCDSKGNVGIDQLGFIKYSAEQCEKQGITQDKFMENQTKSFEVAIEELYKTTFN